MSELSDKEILIMMTTKCADLEAQLEEARDMLLQVQDHMHQLSSHTSDGWAGASADNVFNMIEDKLEEIGDE